MRVELAPPGERIVFEEPSLVVRIERGDDVDAAFATLDAALAAGNAIAGYVTYELGAALAGAAIGDGAVPRDATLPLAAFGIYAAARRVRAPASNGGAFELAPPVALWSRRRYDDELARIAATLRAGDAYQINLTVPFGFAWDGEPRAMFDALVARAGVAHAALVEDGDRAFVSLSPELFLAIHTYNPCFENRSCSTSSAMSSARRNAPAYPSKSSARSRAAGKSSGIAISSAGSRSMRSGSFFFAAVPRLRLNAAAACAPADDRSASRGSHSRGGSRSLPAADAASGGEVHGPGADPRRRAAAAGLERLEVERERLWRRR